MGIEVDPFYKQNLAEWIYDEHKLITYQYLSVNLKVHVNLAKQMLYQFYHEESSSKKKNGHVLRALYYVSGIKVIGKDQLTYTGLLCKEEQLDQVKKEFKSISSIHIYGLEEEHDLSQADELEILGKAVEEMSFGHSKSIADDESITTLGPFTGIKPTPKIHVPESAPSPPAPAVIRPEKKIQDIHKRTNVFGSKPQPAQKNQGTLDFSKAKKTERKPEIKFAVAASAEKPKVKTEPEEKDKVKRNLGSKFNGSAGYSSSSKKKDAEKDKKSKQDEKTRKRIRVISSSSESDSEPEKRNGAGDDSDDDDFIESKAPSRKRKQIVDSESSDDDVKPEIDDEEPLPVIKKQKPSLFPSAPVAKESSANGTSSRRKKMKTIIKEYEDEEGYRVTKKEHVLVSESESDCEEVVIKDKDTNKKVNGSAGTNFMDKESSVKINVKAEIKLQSNTTTSPPSTKSNITKSHQKQSKNSSILQKHKQPSIISFFKKQPAA